MEQIFSALPGILLRALPTFFLILVLHWYFKKVLVQPMERVLEERRQKTAGAVESSEQSLAQAAAKMRQYEQSLAEARAAIFQQQEKSRKELNDRQMAAIEAARTKSGERVAAAKADLAAQAAQAKASLAAESDRLAEQIAGALLTGRVQ
jgi:F-type H+-transporting ATPase subunit b